MTWVKLDDHFDENPKVIAAGPVAVALWVTALAYCNRTLTDGFIPAAMVKRLVDTEEDPAKRLVDVGLWDVAPGGYAVHDYLQFQPSKAKVLAAREDAALRVSRYRKGRNSVTAPLQAPLQTPNISTGNAPGNAPGTGSVTPSPIPIPIPIPAPAPRPDAEPLPWGSELGQPQRDQVLELMNAIGIQYCDDEVYAGLVQLCEEFTWAEITKARALARKTAKYKPFAANIRAHLPRKEDSNGRKEPRRSDAGVPGFVLKPTQFPPEETAHFVAKLAAEREAWLRGDPPAQLPA